MITTDSITWGKYASYAGPYFGGKIPYKIPQNPDENDRRLMVLCATESGHFDSINMYDFLYRFDRIDPMV
jgi:hypothetical protein